MDRRNIWSQRVQTPNSLFICLMIMGDRADLRAWIRGTGKRSYSQHCRKRRSQPMKFDRMLYNRRDDRQRTDIRHKIYHSKKRVWFLLERDAMKLYPSTATMRTLKLTLFYKVRLVTNCVDCRAGKPVYQTATKSTKNRQKLQQKL